MRACCFWLLVAPSVYATQMTPPSMAPPRSSSSLTPSLEPLSDMTTASTFNNQQFQRNNDPTYLEPPLNQDEIDELLWKEAGYKKKPTSSGKPSHQRANQGCGSSSGNGIHEVVKRQDYLSWDDYFFAVAALSAMRSKGACMKRHKQYFWRSLFENGCENGKRR